MKKSSEVLRAGVQVKYAFIRTQEPHHLVIRICTVLGVSRSGNRQRRHQSLGYLRPLEFERRRNGP